MPYCTYITNASSVESVSALTATDGSHLIYVAGKTESENFPNIAAFPHPTEKYDYIFVVVIALSPDCMKTSPSRV